MDEWNKVENALPDAEIAVLVWGPECGFHVATYGIDANHADDNWWDATSGSLIEANGPVTHWMHLPEEPEVRGE